MLLPVGLSYNENREKTVSVESVINMQPEITYGGRQQAALVTCPGMSQFSTGNVNATEGRGAVEINGVMYAVIGRFLYKFTDAGVATNLGGIDGSGICGMSTSGSQIHIAVTGKGYSFDVGTEVLTTITDADYPNGPTSTFINGRFVTADPTPGTSDRFYFSALLDATNWSGLDYATAERKTDNIVNLKGFGDSLVIFGTRSIEFWRSDASGFVPIPGAVSPFGLAARDSVAESGGLLFFLDSNGQVRQMQGYSAGVVSTPAVEFALASDSTAEGLAYVYEGKLIYEISTSSITLCFDATSSQLFGKPIWFEKGSIKNQVEGRHKARASVFAHGKILTLAYDDGKVYSYDRNTIPDYRQFTIMMPVDDDNRQWRTLDEIELIGRTGTGAVPSTSPKVMLRLSRDNGYTYGEEKWAGLGTLGDYAKRVRWKRLGRFLQMAARFRQTDAYDWTITGVKVSGR